MAFALVFGQWKSIELSWPLCTETLKRGPKVVGLETAGQEFPYSFLKVSQPQSALSISSWAFFSSSTVNSMDAQCQAEEYAESLKACFSTFGSRLPSLETLVKEGLHNPASFEHVETFMTIPDSDRHNALFKIFNKGDFLTILYRDRQLSLPYGDDL